MDLISLSPAEIEPCIGTDLSWDRVLSAPTKQKIESRAFGIEFLPGKPKSL